MDKGLNIALNSFFPNLISTGYMGFVPNQYSFELSPSNQELTSKVLPNSIGVIGKAYLPILNRCCNEIKGFEAPAFRFAYLKNVIIVNNLDTLIEDVLQLQKKRKKKRRKKSKKKEKL